MPYDPDATPYKVELVIQMKGDLTPPSKATSHPMQDASSLLDASASGTIIYGDDGQVIKTIKIKFKTTKM